MSHRRLILLGTCVLAACFVIPLSILWWFSTHKVVRVVLLAGDDNIEGFASLKHLSTIMESNENEKVRERFQHLRSPSNASEWASRDDVFVFYERERHKPWHVGPVNVYDYGAQPGLFGPEVEVGNVLGETFDEPVVLVKAGFQQKSLAEDWLSPSRQHEHSLGFAWVHTLKNLRFALQNMDQVLGPNYKKHRTQLVGIIWWHGYSDVVSKEWLDSYDDHLKALLRDFRRELNRPHLPIVVAEAGAGGPDMDAYFFEKPIRMAQQSVCNDTEFAATTKCVATHHFVHPKETHYDRHFHYYGHADSMIEISGTLAEALAELYFQQYEEEELQQEMEADYNSELDEEESISVALFLAMLGLGFMILLVVRGRCSRKTLTWNWNRLFFASTTAPDMQQPQEEDESDSVDDDSQPDERRPGSHRQRRRRKGRGSNIPKIIRSDGNGISMTQLERRETFDSIPGSDSDLVELDEISSDEDEEDGN